MRRDLERLQDVLEAIDRIQQQLTRGRQAFDSDPLLQVWVIHHLEIIGEACRALAEGTRAGFESRFKQSSGRIRRANPVRSQPASSHRAGERDLSTLMARPSRVKSSTTFQVAEHAAVGELVLTKSSVSRGRCAACSSGSSPKNRLS